MGDIIRALYEENIRVIMVTHLFEFVETLYEGKPPYAAFLSAERLPSGERTYKMIPAAPSYNSFGMDLYEEVIESAIRKKAI